MVRTLPYIVTRRAYAEECMRFENSSLGVTSSAYFPAVIYQSCDRIHAGTAGYGKLINPPI